MAKTKEAPQKTSLVVTQATAPPNLIEGGKLPAAASAFLKEVEGPRQQPARVPIIKIDHQDAKFILPSGELVDSVSGYIIHFHQTRNYWKKAPKTGEKGKPPDCWSPDMIRPDSSSVEKQAEMCATCPMSSFGTAADGSGQACRTRTWLFLVNPEFGTPPIAVVIAPPSSIRTLLGTRFDSGYLAQATAKYGVYEIVWTTFTLEERGDKVKHAALVPHMGEAAEDARAAQLARMRNTFMEAFQNMRGAPSEASDDELAEQ